MPQKSQAVILRLSLAVLAGLAFLTSGCLAPMCRTSEVEHGLSLSAEVGPTVFHSTGIVNDTTRWWGGRTVPLTCAGLQGDLRAAYGFARWLGADLTAGFNAGSILNRPESLHQAWTGMYRLGAAALFRPWQHNSLMFVEYQMPHLLSLGWVSGFPVRGPEQWSVMAQLGIIPWYVATHELDASWRDFVPEHLQLGLRRNFRLGSVTLAPALGTAVSWNWDTFTPTVTSVTLGCLWSSPITSGSTRTP